MEHRGECGSTPPPASGLLGGAEHRGECGSTPPTGLRPFFGAFWVSELVAAGKRDTSQTALQVEDFSRHQGNIVFLVRQSKTDQQAWGQRVILGPCSVEDISPVQAMEAYMGLRGEAGGPLFRHASGEPLIKFQFWWMTEVALDKLGLVG
ncbi:hypothetical protein JRQ81_017603, partial [Phrynocephalus forsythii]